MKKVEVQVAQILRRPDVRERLLGAGVDPIGGTPETLVAAQRSEIEKLAKIVKEQNLTPD